MHSLLKHWPLALTLAIAISNVASASIPAPLSIEELISNADVVAHIVIERTEPQFSEGVNCGTRITARVIESFKTKSKAAHGSTITFGRDGNLKRGDGYLIFLRYQSSVETIYERAPPELKSSQTRARGLEIVRCNGLVPGLESDFWSTWRVLSYGVRVNGFLPRPWPNSITTHMRTSPVETVVSRRELFNYLRKIDSSKADQEKRP
jgi:hypothetical protein